MFGKSKFSQFTFDKTSLTKDKKNKTWTTTSEIYFSYVHTRQ